MLNYDGEFMIFKDGSRLASVTVCIDGIKYKIIARCADTVPSEPFMNSGICYEIFAYVNDSYINISDFLKNPKKIFVYLYETAKLKDYHKRKNECESLIFSVEQKEVDKSN